METPGQIKLYNAESFGEDEILKKALSEIQSAVSNPAGRQRAIFAALARIQALLNANESPLEESSVRHSARLKWLQSVVVLLNEALGDTHEDAYTSEEDKLTLLGLSFSDTSNDSASQSESSFEVSKKTEEFGTFAWR